MIKYGGPTEIFSLVITSKKIGYVVPIKTTAKKYIINQLLIIIAVSLLKKNDLFTFSKFSYLKYMITDIKISIDKKINTKTPLSGSFAKV